jgi:dTDP-4-dehydrorhamnose reductase
MTPLLVTGLTGLVASRFQELYSQDFDFTNIDLATGIDITDQVAVNRVIAHSPASALIHFAAFTNVDAAHQQHGDKSGLCYRINVDGSRNVAHACTRHGKYLIHISTDFVFDGVNPPPGGYTEESLPHPIEWYGQTKLWAEEEVQKYGAKYCIARITYPFRAYFPPKPDLIRSVMAKLKAGNLPPMFTDHIITPTFIDDIAVALKAMLDQHPQDIFHIVGSSNLSDYQIACQVARAFDLDESQVKPGSLENYLAANPRPYQKNLATSNAKLKRELGVTMRTLDEALAAMKQQLSQ